MTVTIRRNRDNRYLTKSHGAGRIVQFTRKPGEFKSRLEAITIIRVELGDDLANYTIEELTK